jgi:hypothetical protein
VVSVENGYELRYEDKRLATLGDPKFEAEVECVTRDGAWRFARLRGGHTEATDGAGIVARYKSNALPGGTITLGDEIKLKLRPPVMGETWRVRRGIREAVLEIRAPKGPWEVEFAAGARDIYQLPLLTMFAFHAMLVELDRPSGGISSADGVGL